MEKLIKLIWEWQKETHPDGIYLPVVAYRDWIFWSDSDCLSSVMDEIHLVSKSNKFIDRLIKNDKLDMCKLHSWWIENHWLTAEVLNDLSDVNVITMILSISDDITKDLISYLK